MTPSFCWRTDAEAHRAQQRTHEIDQFLDEEAEKAKNTHKIVLFGDTSEIEVLTRQIIIFTCTAAAATAGFCYDDPDKRSSHRDAVRKTVLEILEEVGLSVKGINEMELLPSADGMDKGAFLSHIKTLQSIIRPSGNNIEWNKIITSQMIDAVSTLSRSEAFVDLARKTCGTNYNYCIPYFLHKLQQIAEPDYIPTKSDIVRAPSRLFSHTALTIPGDCGNVEFVVTGLMRGERRKWIHLLDDFTEIMFLCDLASYDREPGVELLLDIHLEVFDSVVSSQFFNRRRSSRSNRSEVPIILLLGNVSVLKEKLPRSPFGTFYADYSGENNADGVVDYTIKRFREIGGKQQLVIYPYTVDAADSASWSDVWKDIQEEVLYDMPSRGDLKR